MKWLTCPQACMGMGNEGRRGGSDDSQISGLHAGEKAAIFYSSKEREAELERNTVNCILIYICKMMKHMEEHTFFIYKMRIFLFKRKY